MQVTIFAQLAQLGLSNLTLHNMDLASVTCKPALECL